MPLPSKSKTKRIYQKTQENNANLQKRLDAKEIKQRPKTILEGPVKDGDDTYLHQTDMLRLMLLQETLLHAETKAKKSQSDLARIESQYLHQRDRLVGDSFKASVAKAKIEAELNKLHKAFEDEYEISINELSFDTETGLINKPVI